MSIRSLQHPHKSDSTMGIHLACFKLHVVSTYGPRDFRLYKTACKKKRKH